MTRRDSSESRGRVRVESRVLEVRHSSQVTSHKNATRVESRVNTSAWYNSNSFSRYTAKNKNKLNSVILFSQSLQRLRDKRHAMNSEEFHKKSRVIKKLIQFISGKGRKDRRRNGSRSPSARSNLLKPQRSRPRTGLVIRDGQKTYCSLLTVVDAKRLNSIGSCFCFTRLRR